MPKRKRQSAAGRKAAKPMVKRIDVKLPPAVYTQVQERVKKGQFLSMSAFSRAAIREKLAALKPSKRNKK